MATRLLLRCLAVLVIVGSTLGTRTPAAAAVPPPRAFGSAIEAPRLVPSTPIVDLDTPIAAEVARLVAADELSRWLAAEETNRVRADAEIDELWRLRVDDIARRIYRSSRATLPTDEVEMIIHSADRHEVDPVLLGRIGVCESGGRADAYNPSGASGFGQHLASYWPGRAAAAGWAGASPFDLAANIDVTAWYLAAAGTGPWVSSRYCWS